MKLELKHLAGYLPCNLEVRIDSGCTSAITNISLNGFDRHFLYALSENNIKVIGLRPLSDLTKEIEINGEKFIPIVKLLILNYPSQEKEGRYSEITVSEEGFANAFYTFQANRCLTIYTNNIICIPFWIIEKLLEWKFDIYGLIENDLVIDINEI